MSKLEDASDVKYVVDDKSFVIRSLFVQVSDVDVNKKKLAVFLYMLFNGDRLIIFKFFKLFKFLIYFKKINRCKFV